MSEKALPVDEPIEEEIIVEPIEEQKNHCLKLLLRMRIIILK